MNPVDSFPVDFMPADGNAAVASEHASAESRKRGVSPSGSAVVTECARVATLDGENDTESSSDSGNSHLSPEKREQLRKRRRRRREIKGMSERRLPKNVVKVLKAWMLSPEHYEHPYPDDHDRAELCAAVGINERQLITWFTNARKRIWAPLRRVRGEPLPSTFKVHTAAVAAETGLDYKADVSFSAMLRQPLASTSRPLTSLDVLAASVVQQSLRKRADLTVSVNTAAAHVSPLTDDTLLAPLPMTASEAYKAAMDAALMQASMYDSLSGAPTAAAEDVYRYFGFDDLQFGLDETGGLSLQTNRPDVGASHHAPM